MRIGTQMILSWVTAAVLLGGCNGGSHEQRGVAAEQKRLSGLSAEGSQQLTLTVAEAPVQGEFPSDFYTPGADSVMHLADGETLHLDAHAIGWQLPGPVVSWRWEDMDGNVLSRDAMLDRTLYYDSNYDPDGAGVTRYVKTVTVRDASGAEASKSFIVCVHRDAMADGRAILGPVAGAYFTLTALGQERILADGITSDEREKGLAYAGLIHLDPALAQRLPEGYYLLRVTGGEDLDRDDDGEIDAEPTPNLGTLYAIVTPQSLAAGGYRVTALSTLCYTLLKESGELTSMSDSALAEALEVFAITSLREDVDGDGDIDYDDVLHWSPVTGREQVEPELLPILTQLTDMILGGISEEPEEMVELQRY